MTRSLVSTYLVLVVIFATGCNQNTDSSTGRGDSANDARAEADVEKSVPDPQPFAIDVEADEETSGRVTVTVVAAEGWGLSKSDLEQIAARLLSMSLLGAEDQLPTATTLPSLTPMLGSYTVTGDSLTFQPTFRLTPGVRYAIRFDPGPLNSESTGKVIWQEYRAPRATDTAPPKLLTMTPTADVLPANHLKFYLQFSEPMQTGDIWQHFRLDNLTKNAPVPRPFRHTELWSEDRQTLTLWFHPGRQKTGVNLNVEVGPVLHEGDDYRLIVSSEWKSARGVQLPEEISKDFRAGPPDHEQLFVEKWRIASPKPDTQDTLIIDLGESLDAALLRTEIAVENAAGKPVPGTISLEKQESVWTFRPDTPWDAGVYRLAVGSVLEDLSGNSIERPFEVDLEGEPLKPVGSTVRRTFTIGDEPK